MSRAPREAINVPDAGIASIGNDQYPPQSGPNQASHEMSNFVDGSGPIFSMYLEMATEEDKKMAEGWKADADGILFFTGLFSAAVASLISVSIQDIRPNPQDTSNFYLANIYQTLADPNLSTISSSLPASLPPFSPPNHAVCVNALWFLSLVISITCALLATLLQQWARRYLKVTQPRCSQHKRARVRAFFFEGIDKFLLPWVVEALPTLVHVSLFLFFAGLVVFLCNVDLTIFKLVLSWIGVCTALYGCITIMPLFRHDCPYHTPLTSLAWPIVIGIPYVVHGVLRWFTWSIYSHDGALRYFGRLEEGYRKLLVQGMQKAAEETALSSSSEIDTRAFVWTFDSLDEDHELERFFSGLPGFRSSIVVGDPLPRLTEEQRERLSVAWMGLLDRTSSSNSLPESDRNRRAVICAKAIPQAAIPDASQWILDSIMSGDHHQGLPLRTAEFGRIVRSWANSLSGNQGAALVIQAILTSIVATAQRRNDPWFILASDELGVPGSVLRDYAAHGNSLSLSVLIHIIRRQFDHFGKSSWPGIKFSLILEMASKFDVKDTSHELQHEFCALWSQIVLKAQNDSNQAIAVYILRPIRKIYIALHRGTKSAPNRFSASTGNLDDILFWQSSYPVCNVVGHIHDDSAATTYVRNVPNDDVALAPVTPAGPGPSSSSAPAPLHVVEILTDVPPFDNSRPVQQATIKSLHIPATSSDPVTAHVMRDGTDTSTRMIPISTPDIFASAIPTSEASSHSTGTAHVHRAETHHASSGHPDDPPSPSPTLVLDGMLLTGLLLSPNSPLTGSDHTSSPESHSSVLVPTSSSLFRPQLSSVPDLSTEGDSRAKAVSHKKDDAPYPSPTFEDIMTTSDLPPQLPLLMTDVTIIAGHSRRSLNYTGDRPQNLSRGQYNIV